MAISEQTAQQAQEDLEQALKIAKRAWEAADMPQIIPGGYAAEATKPAFAILASTILTIYGNS
ncbi:hypothetical protein A2333_01395 [Candidatus Wolfebacteria bacterium RIFOXYB2_FULL_49_7]|uniref:Uncharacterized protein n=1 Tax=Candidatus Wolfebacteria bacterium RIFOXYB1_FULL_54_12 TaxID=1802559 RepID=A0A1F8DYT1_9BACT|nr:MAG: hypothetical protein A2372_02430 [Candidatus Wolfebacteria bacterium RIFOXYB1_FULL_54_12]OGM95866.1 MAG: hypothetical protein A2333_01395 [Candidatus Wolfebacteria bacterium RIFOXYB2_FULL_49_7]